MKIKIYTDGACSKNPGPGGWAAIFCLENDIKSLKGNELKTTNNRMELKAVVFALHKILEISSKEKNNEFELFSDSAYVVNAINGKWIESWLLNGWKTKKGDDVKNKDLWEKFMRLRSKLCKRNVKLTICKVKGHNGNTFNEIADKVAREESTKAKNFILKFKEG